MSSSCKRFFPFALWLLAATVSAAEPQAINLEITSYLGDGQTFTEGDEISFMLSLDQPAYIYLFYQDATNQLTQILPNPKQPENYYQPGQFIPVPDPKAGFKFIVQAPFGEEKLWAFASDSKIDFLNSKAPSDSRSLTSYSINKIREYFRRLSSTIYDEDVTIMKTSTYQ